MANAQRVRGALRTFITSMKAHDEAIPEELAEDALEMVEEVTDALCEDEEANPLEITKDEDPPVSISEQVQDAVARTLKEYGLIKDPSMKALDELEEKIEAVVRKVYGGDGITVMPNAKKQIAQLEALGFSKCPVCIAKTQYSFSDDPTKLGAPEHFTVTVKNVKVSAGAGFIVVLTGDILTMPGLPKVPAAERIDVDESGRITGLF